MADDVLRHPFAKVISVTGANLNAWGAAQAAGARAAERAAVEYAALARDSAARGREAAQGIAAAKSPGEILARQTELQRQLFESCLMRAARIGTAWADAARESDPRQTCAKASAPSADSR